MSLLIAFITTLVGLIILAWSGDKLVAGAAALAQRLKVSDVFIGIVIIGFGTSLPEVMATVSAARLGQNSLALGNIIGSNIANIGLILALTLILTKKSQTYASNVRDYITMLLALVLFAGLIYFRNGLDATAGAILLAGLGAYLLFSMIQSKATENSNSGQVEITIILMSIFIIGGLVGLALGAELLVRGATEIARMLGVSERVIGITLVAVGTSLPELSAAVAAAKHGKTALTIGNILGSNAFNVFAAAGASSLFTPLLADGFMADLIIMFAFSLALIPLFLARKTIPLRLLGILILGGYLLYNVFLFSPCLWNLICAG